MRSNCDVMSSATSATSGLNNAVRLATVIFTVFLALRVLDRDSSIAILGLLLILGIFSYDFTKAAAAAAALDQSYTVTAANQTDVLWEKEVHKASIDSAPLGAVSAAGSMASPVVSIVAMLAAVLCMSWIFSELRVAWETKGDSTTATMVKKATCQHSTRARNSNPTLVRRMLLFSSLAVVLALIPTALAEPTGTTLFSQGLPVMSPTITASATSPPELRAKDRPQSWLYRSAGDKLAPCLWLCLLPLIMMGSFLLPALLGIVILEAIASSQGQGNRHSKNTISSKYAETSHKTRAPRAPQTTLPPVWLTYYSTTTTTLPVVTVTAPPCTEENQAVCAVVPWQPLPPDVPAMCTEANPAVCPIVLGRKDWRPAESGAVRARGWVSHKALGTAVGVVVAGVAAG